MKPDKRLIDVRLQYFNEVGRATDYYVAQARPQQFEIYLSGYGKTADEAIQSLNNSTEAFYIVISKQEEE